MLLPDFGVGSALAKEAYEEYPPPEDDDPCLEEPTGPESGISPISPSSSSEGDRRLVEPGPPGILYDIRLW